MGNRNAITELGPGGSGLLQQMTARGGKVNVGLARSETTAIVVDKCVMHQRIINPPFPCETRRRLLIVGETNGPIRQY